MKKIFFFMAALFPFVAIAQSNYHQGFIIKNSGDTVKGFVNYREWVYSPESVEFKITQSGPLLKLTADSIKGFGVEGVRSYCSYVGDITLNKNIFPNIPTGIDTDHEVRAIFLKPIRIGGKVALYYNNEVNKDRFFVAEGNGKPNELKYYEYYTSGSAEAYGNAYKTQLQQLAGKYNKNTRMLLLHLEDARYDMASISAIIDEINGADTKKMDSVVSANRPSPIRFIAGLAGNYTTNASPSSNAFTPRFNAGIDVFFNPDVQQLILRLELGYTWTNGMTPAYQQTDYGVAIINVPFKQNTFSVSPQIIFNIYNTDSFKFYIGGGASANFSSYESQTYMQPFWVSVPLQAGIVFDRKWEVFVSYAFKTSFFGSDFNTTSQSDCLGIKRLF